MVVKQTEVGLERVCSGVRERWVRFGVKSGEIKGSKIISEEQFYLLAHSS